MLHPTPPRVRIIQGATMASDPSLPTSECRLSGVGESTMGLGRWSGPCREWSGPRVQGREMWGATHSCWQKWLFYCAVSAHNTEAQGRLPRQPDVLPGARAAILLLRCLIVWREARRTKGQRWQCPISIHMLGETIWHQQVLAGRCFSSAAKAPVWASQAC